MRSKERGFFVRIKEGKKRQTRRSSVTSSAAVAQPDAESREKDRSRAAGFTLLEVMIALAIVSIALAALIGLGNRSIATSQRLQKLTQATLLAQEVMSGIQTAAGGDRSDREGEFTEPFAGFSWQTRYTPTPVSDVQQVDVLVRWGDAAANEEVTLTSFVFR